MRNVLLLCCIQICFAKISAEEIGWNERAQFAVLYDDVLRDNEKLWIFERMMGEFFITFQASADRDQMVADLTGEGKPLAGYSTSDMQNWILFQAPRSERLRLLECPRLQDELMENLRMMEGIRHVSPALIREGGYLKGMPHFEYSVALKEGVNPAEVFGDRAYRFESSPSIYKLSAEGSSWRQMRRELNLLGLDPRVRWVEPNYTGEAISLGGLSVFSPEAPELLRPIRSCTPGGVQLSINRGGANAVIRATAVEQRMIMIQEWRDGSWKEITTRAGGMEEEFEVNVSGTNGIFRALAY